MALYQTARLIFHPLPVSTFVSRQKCGWIITVTKMCKGVKSPLTHFISSTHNGHPGMTKNTVLTWDRFRGGGGSRGWWNCRETHIFKHNMTCNLCEILFLLVKHANWSLQCSRTSASITVHLLFRQWVSLCGLMRLICYTHTVVVSAILLWTPDLTMFTILSSIQFTRLVYSSDSLICPWN